MFYGIEFTAEGTGVHAREQPHIDKITIDLTWIEEKDGVVV
jgi:hypothetical protein